MGADSGSAVSGNRAKLGLLVPTFEFQKVIIWPFMLPVVSIGGAILLSMILHWEDVTTTHCRVSNYLPTISAAVGDNAPEKYLFRFGIGNYTSLKIIFDLTVFFMLKALREHKKKIHGSLPYSQASFEFWNYASLILVIIEDLLLCLLTMVSSTDDKMIHVLSFAGFMIFAHTHFVASLLNNIRARSPFTEDEKRWFRYRVIYACLHALVFGCAIYLYWRHNAYCEPGIYSLFAFCEYTVVAMNICFHGVGFFEWGHLKYVIRDFGIHSKEE